MTVSFDMLVTTLGPFLVLLFIICSSRYRRLSHIPGPFLAAFTDLWRAYHQNVSNPVDFARRLHAQHGPIVRVGPYTVSVSDATAMPAIFPPNGEFLKADSYLPLRVPTALGHSVGSVIDLRSKPQITALRRAFGPALTSKAVEKYESDIDTSAIELIDMIRTHPKLNIFKIMQFFQMDVLTKIAFSKNFHNLREQRDVWGVTASLSQRINHWLSWQAMPHLDFYLRRHPFWCWFWKTPRSSRWVIEALDQLNQRLEGIAEEGKHSALITTTPKHDLLQQYIEAAHRRKDVEPDTLRLITTSTISAGFDTTASTLTQMLYHLSTNPSTLDKLRQESATLPSDPPIPRWEQVKKLQYLKAVFQEVVRVNSHLSIPLDRVVPSAGVTICGRYLPPGTVVGAQLGVVHQDAGVFGHHYPVDQFQPERWLEATDAQRLEMDKGSLGFGAGNRTCLGRQLSEMEIKKVIPPLIQNFNMALLTEEVSGETGSPRHMGKEIILCFTAIGKTTQSHRRATAVS